MELTLLNLPTGYSIVGPNGILMGFSLTEAELGAALSIIVEQSICMYGRYNLVLRIQ